MKQSFLIFAASALLAATLAAGQNTTQTQIQPQTTAPPTPKGTIEGTVTRAGTGQPLKGVRVSVRRTDPAPNAARGGRGLAAGRGGAAGAGGATGAPALGTGGGGAAAGAGAGQVGGIANLLGALAGRGAATNTVTTDSAGRFEVTGLDAGQYQLTAERDGLIRQEFGRQGAAARGAPITLNGGQRFVADMQLSPAGVVAGIVRDETGEPTFRATLQAYTYRYANGDRTLAQVATAQTNDLGEYRLFPLTPGDYFVSVNAPSSAGPASQIDASAQRGAAGLQLPAAGGLQGLAALQPLLQNLTQQQPRNTTATLYYPGTVDPDSANELHVAASAEIRGIDFTLRPVTTFTVSGRVAAPFALGQTQQAPQANAQGRGGLNAGAILGLLGGLTQNAQVSLTPVGAAGRAGIGNALRRMNGVQVAADGAFEIRNVVPGSYYLAATASNEGQRYSGRVRLDVSGGDVSNAVVSVNPSIEVRGLIVAEQPPTAFQMSQVRVSLVEADNPGGNVANVVSDLIGTLLSGGRGGTRGAGAGAAGGRGALAAGNGQVSDDGSFSLSNVSPGVEYRVRVTGASGGYLAQGRIGSVDALSAPFTLEGNSVVQLQLAFSTGRVSGTALDNAGKTFAGAQAVLVPDAPRRGRSDMYFSTTADAMGAFTFANVPDGGYRLFAWEDVPAGAYAYPEFLKPYETMGVAIRVEKGGSPTGEVRVIPAEN